MSNSHFNYLHHSLLLLKGLDFEIPPPSPPLNLHELSGPAEGAPLTPKSSNPTKGLDAPSKRSADKAVSVEVMDQGGAQTRLTFLLSPGMAGTEGTHGPLGGGPGV